MSLTFAELRAANLLRLPQFRDRQGRICHRQIEGQPVGFDWALLQWSNAVCGELGEAANIIKKIERGDYTLDEARADLGRELADVQTYLDLLAHRAGVDLGAATVAKWNEVSERVGTSLRLVAAPSESAPVLPVTSPIAEALRYAEDALAAAPADPQPEALSVPMEKKCVEKVRRYEPFSTVGESAVCGRPLPCSLHGTEASDAVR